MPTLVSLHEISFSIPLQRFLSSLFNHGSIHFKDCLSSADQKVARLSIDAFGFLVGMGTAKP